MGCPLERWRHDPVFKSQPTPTLLLDRDCTIAAVSRSRLPLTGWHEDDLVGRNLFETFPETPGRSGSGATAAFVESFERTLRTGRPHRLNAVRYDLEDRRAPGTFLTRWWSVVTAPVRFRDVLGVMAQVEDVTFLDEGAAAGAGPRHDKTDEPESGEVPAPLARMLSEYAQMAAEVAQLREALRARPSIEQAKGIIMADRKCGPDEAFALLKRLSNNTNVRLADVAAAVVYQRSH